jgi:hypothetical protein
MAPVILLIFWSHECLGAGLSDMARELLFNTSPSLDPVPSSLGAIEEIQNCRSTLLFT